MYGQPIGRVVGRPSGAPETADAPSPSPGASGIHPEQQALPPLANPEPLSDLFSQAHEKASLAVEHLRARDLASDALADAARRFDAIAQGQLPAMVKARLAGALHNNARLAAIARFGIVAPALERCEEVYDEEHGRGAEAEDEGQQEEPDVQLADEHTDEAAAELAEEEARLFEMEETRIVRPPPTISRPAVKRATRAGRGVAARAKLERDGRPLAREVAARAASSARGTRVATQAERREIEARNARRSLLEDDLDAADRVATERQLPASGALRSKVLPRMLEEDPAPRVTRLERQSGRTLGRDARDGRLTRHASRAEERPERTIPDPATDPFAETVATGAGPAEPARAPRESIQDGETLESELERAWLDALDHRASSPEVRALVSSLAGRRDRTRH